jgi:hypothetical protein
LFLPIVYDIAEKEVAAHRIFRAAYQLLQLATLICRRVSDIPPGLVAEFPHINYNCRTISSHVTGENARLYYFFDIDRTVRWGSTGEREISL